MPEDKEQRIFYKGQHISLEEFVQNALEQDLPVMVRKSILSTLSLIECRKRTILENVEGIEKDRKTLRILLSAAPLTGELAKIAKQLREDQK